MPRFADWYWLKQLSFAYLTFLVSPHTYGWVQLANRSSNSHSFKLAWKPFFWLEHFQAFFYLTHFLRINLSYQQPWEIFFLPLADWISFPFARFLKALCFQITAFLLTQKSYPTYCTYVHVCAQKQMLLFVFAIGDQMLMSNILYYYFWTYLLRLDPWVILECTIGKNWLTICLSRSTCN